jgi:uncharacterized protein YcaQ
VVAVVRRLGLVQIDSVNVLARAHYLPVFSRVGAFPTTWLDEAALPRGGRPPALTEYWAHEASLLPVESYPLLRWRMDAVDTAAWGGMVAVARDRPELVDAVLGSVAADGPVTAAELEALHGKRVRSAAAWGWRWSDVKRALEYLFWSGAVVAAGRGPGFQRRYDLPERVLPAEVLASPPPSRAGAVRALVEVAARVHGVATEPDLRDYFRLPAALSRGAVADLVDEGVLVPVGVQGWAEPAYLHAEAVVPRRVGAQALVGPFDPLVWTRARVERLFGFRYRVEIYVPAAQRVHGYYVLPFLLGDRLPARVDLKHDRRRGVLVVRAAWAEAGAPEATAPALAASLLEMAEWLGAGAVEVEHGGDLAAALSWHLR